MHDEDEEFEGFRIGVDEDEPIDPLDIPEDENLGLLEDDDDADKDPDRDH
jgi:hypothetical protein